MTCGSARVFLRNSKLICIFSPILFLSAKLEEKKKKEEEKRVKEERDVS